MSGRAPESSGIARVVVATLLCACATACTSDDARPAVEASSTVVTIDSAARAPDGTRVRVEVLNAGGVAGLARRATLFLRDAGYDVVSYGTSPDTASGTTIRVTATSRGLGERVQRALGTGRVEEIEELRYVDVVVLLGRDWTSPAEPLRP
ncbi:MAG TPA: LytR C-terminal domain-containing protein [Gemmatimonadaceae bacterium]|nr:LytR C-terminal domain-containing protein [Gemmatimonadaceae bacterium]